MVDEADRAFHQGVADGACEKLLDAAEALAEVPLQAAKKLISNDRARTYESIVRLEITGSMAVDRLLASYTKRALSAVKELKDQENAGGHMLQAIVNPVVGGVMAFTDDMPPVMQTAFVAMLVEHLQIGVKFRNEQKARRKREAGRGPLN